MALDEEFNEKYFEFRETEKEYLDYLKSVLVGRKVMIKYRRKNREAIIKDAYGPDYWGIYLELDIPRLDGNGMIDDWNARFTKLNRVELI
jgi:hypothetical protein